MPPGSTPPPAYTIEQIAYVLSPSFYGDPDGEIYLMYANGSGPKRLTFASGYESELAWSPDGSKLAFVRDIGGTRQIHSMNADGSQDVNLSNGPASDIRPAWSPDGQKILFQRLVTVNTGSLVLKNWEVYVMNADGSGQTNLSQSSLAYDGDARWAPDGSQIVFVSKRDGNSEIYRMNVDGSAKLNLTQDARPDSVPDWSPVGDKIAFVRTLTATRRLHVMNTNGTGLVGFPLPDEPFSAPHVARWSPSGGKILASGDWVWTINADGTGAVHLPQTDVFHPGWSADGGRVIASWGDGPCPGLDVVSVKPDGTGFVDLSPCDDLSARWPAWRPKP